MTETLKYWLHEGKHADMHFMEEHVEKRGNPQLLVEGAQSVISLAVGYKPNRLMKGPLRVAQYAYGEDYHERLKRMLFALIKSIQEACPEFEAKPCVDTVPISDKRWAEQAGLGWIGKNSLLVTEEFGSYVNLAELVTTTEFDTYDTPIQELCGDCECCVKACPNQAISNSLVDARKCNAYNTIENRSDQLNDANLKGYVFGCDCCQMACPFNQQAKSAMDFNRAEMDELETLLSAEKSTFKKVTRHKALNRIKFAQWQRNIEKAQGSLETKRLRFRRWQESDAETLFAYACDPELGPRAGWAPHQSVAESLMVIQEILTNDWTWAITLKETGAIVGTIAFYTKERSNIEISPHDAEVGYWIAREYWNRGICTEAVRLMIEVLRERNYRTIWADHFVDNPASGKVLEKCGFEDTGELNKCSHLLGGDCNKVKIYKLKLSEDQPIKN